MKVGTQIFGLKKELTDDFYGCLDQLCDAGFDVVEGIVTFFEPEQGEIPLNDWVEDTLEKAVAHLAKRKVTVPSFHTRFDPDREDFSIEALAEITRRVKERTGISRFIANGMFDDKEGAEKWAKIMKAWAEAVEEDDCMIIYHNHDMELDKIEADGKKTTALDHFFALAGDKVMMQIDLGWAAFAAGDPYAVLSKYKDRIASIHLKDLAPEVLKPGIKREDLCASSFVAIGAGGVDYSRLLEKVAECKNFDSCFIIDQDNSAGSMMEDLKEGCEYIRALTL